MSWASIVKKTNTNQTANKTMVSPLEIGNNDSSGDPTLSPVHTQSQPQLHQPKRKHANSSSSRYKRRPIMTVDSLYDTQFRTPIVEGITDALANTPGLSMDGGITVGKLYRHFESYVNKRATVYKHFGSMVIKNTLSNSVQYARKSYNKKRDKIVSLKKDNKDKSDKHEDDDEGEEDEVEHDDLLKESVIVEPVDNDELDDQEEIDEAEVLDLSMSIHSDEEDTISLLHDDVTNYTSEEETNELDESQLQEEINDEADAGDDVDDPDNESYDTHTPSCVRKLSETVSNLHQEVSNTSVKIVETPKLIPSSKFYTFNKERGTIIIVNPIPRERRIVPHRYRQACKK